jgi:hypothetical protein
MYPTTENQLRLSFERWSELNRLDVSGYIKKKQSLDYLSWAVVERLLREHLPTFEVRFCLSDSGSPVFRLGGEGSGYLLPYLYETTSGKYTSPILFPVYDNRFGDADPESAAAVNKSMQRASAKLVAIETGIGFSLYSRIEEDLPSDEPQAPQTDSATSPRRTSFRRKSGGVS